jgi:DNA-binding beta-propeller fold protein YncE
MNRREFLLASAAAPFALGLAPPTAFGRGRGGTPLGVVTADLESRVVLVDLASGRLAGHRATLPGPRSIESVGGATAVIAHTADGAVSLLDARTLAVAHVLREFQQPRYTAAHPDGRHAFVTDSLLGRVFSVDVLRGRVLGDVELGGPARHVSIDPTGRTLWIALGPKAAELAVVDVTRLHRPRLVETIRPPFLAHDVGFAPGGRRVWVSSGDRGALAVYDARDRHVLRRLPADAPPQHVTFLGGLAYVTSGDDGTLRVHSLHDGRALRTTRVPVGSYNVQQGWGRILTPSLDRGTLCVADARGKLVQERRLARSSHDACVLLAPV